jgi:hypothetical protein
MRPNIAGSHSRMDNTAVALLVGLVLCLIILGIGVAIGIKLGRVAGPALVIATQPREQSLDRRTDVDRMLSAWIDLRLRLMEVAQGICDVQQMPHGLLVEWRKEFTRLANNLSQTIDGKVCAAEPLRVESRRIIKNQNAAPADIGHADLISNEQILELLSQIGQPRDSSRPLLRYKFSAKQFLAPAVDDGPLPPEAFSLVQCHDLSLRDIRYFVDQPATEGKVVIGLGVPTPVKWIAAQIEDSRTAYRYGRVGYLVTARLLAAIDSRSHTIPNSSPAETLLVS